MSLKLLLDENMPPQVAGSLRALGYDAVHVREEALKGSKDPEVMAFARKTHRCLITLDADFADLRRYPLSSHCGIIRLRLKFAPSGIVLGVLRSLLPRLSELPIQRGALVVTDGKRFRVRLPSPS